MIGNLKVDINSDIKDKAALIKNDTLNEDEMTAILRRAPTVFLDDILPVEDEEELTPEEQIERFQD